MSIVHSLSETDSLELILMVSYSFRFWQLSTRYSSCIFHSRIFSVPSPRSNVKCFRLMLISVMSIRSAAFSPLLFCSVFLFTLP